MFSLNLKKLFAQSFLLLVLAFSISFSVFAGTFHRFSSLISIGDSLSDIGNEQDAPYTNLNPDGSKGSLWVNFLAQDLDLNVAPSSQDGTIYAYAGAQNGVLPFGVSSNAPTLTAQLQSYLGDVHVQSDPQALYTVWGGGNDLKNAFLAGINSQDMPILISSSTDNLVNIAKVLHAIGAKNILIPNVPNLGQTPIAVTLNTSTALTALAESFNAELLSSLNASHLNVIQVDTFGLSNTVQQNYALFGFSGPYSTQSNLVNPFAIPGDPTTSIFFDGLHPSQVLHRIVADYFLSVLQAPSFASLLAYTPVHIMQAQNELLNTQIWMDFERKNRHLSKERWHIYTGVDQKRLHEKTTNEFLEHFKENNSTLLIGVHYDLDEQNVIGFALSHSIQSVYKEPHAGDFKIHESILNFINAHKFLDEGYVNNTLGIGYIRENHIHRDFMLGNYEDHVSGSTRGQHYSLQTEGRYDFNFLEHQLKTGPLAGFNIQDIHIHSYTEKSPQFQNDSIGTFDAFRFHQQHYRPFTGQLGWQAHYETSIKNVTVLPFIEIKRIQSFFNDSHKVTAGISSLPGSHFKFYTPEFKQNYTLIQTGVQAIFLKDIMVTANYSFRDMHLFIPESFKVNVSWPLG